MSVAAFNDIWPEWADKWTEWCLHIGRLLAESTETEKYVFDVTAITKRNTLNEAL